MNKLDFIVVIVLVLSFVLGYRRGFVLQLVSLLGLLAAFVAAYLFQDDIAPYVARFVPLDAFIQESGFESLFRGLSLEKYIIAAISFALLLFGVKLALTAVGHLLNLLVKAPGLNFINRWTGGALSVLEAAAAAAIAIQVMAILPYDSVQGMLEGSRAALWSMEWVPALFGNIKELPSSVV